MTVRRYFVTVTPGTATGYWNAMKRPIRARSSGSASVTSSPLKQIVPSVTSRFGWPMITFASVDLPEPFGPIRAWISPFETSRSSPLRISLSPALTCRFLISRSANWRRLLSENSTSSASVVFCKAFSTPPWTRVQSSLVAQPWPWSTSCEHATWRAASPPKQSIGAIGPSSACTTSAMSIADAGRASR